MASPHSDVEYYMTVVSEQTEEYQRRRPTYEAFTQKLEPLVRDLLALREIESTMESRTKTLDSFEEKINRSGKNYTVPLEQVSDLTGLRIITRTLSDVAAIRALLGEEFSVDNERTVDKRDELEPTHFGYISLHVILRLKSPRVDTSEWRRFAGFVAEVQVRTYAQHAWANVQRPLDYKQGSDIPSALRRRLYRLSALFELADDELEAISREGNQLRVEYTHQFRHRELDVELNVDSLRTYIEEAPETQSLARFIESLGVTITPVGLISRDVAMARRAGIKSIADIAKMIADGQVWVRDFLADYYRTAHGEAISQGRLSTDMNGVVTMALIASFPAVFTPEVMEKEFGWGFPERILASAARALRAHRGIPQLTN
jgi:putative GTP pyrophosphokinase